MKRMIRVLFGILLVATGSVAQIYFAPNPGPARAEISPTGNCRLRNAILDASWHTGGGKLQGNVIVHRGTRALPLQPSPFVLLLRDGSVVSASELKLAGAPKIEDLAVQTKAARLAERLPGKAVVVELEDARGRLHITWRALLRDGSNYVRQEITLLAQTADVAISEVRMLDWNLLDARVIGTVKGSPVVSDGVFAGFEHPLSRCAVGAGRARCVLTRELPLKAGGSVTYSSVIGVTAPGQLRRGFLYYLERERAHPYRTFLHYNSWYDLGYFSQYDEAGALDRITAFGTELNKKRGVQLDSFLFDDGWDDPNSLWKFHAGFPDGFRRLRHAAESYGAAPGIWMSPWGGYGKPRQQRITAGRAAGYEIVDAGFALSGPKYYRLFRNTCLEMIRRYGVNQFKFDGTGNANRVVSGSQFDSDFDAAISLIGELRAEKPDLYVNLTTGTYASPFWLRYADSIWRGGEDHDFLGAGSSRERWITYRDAETYEGVVLQGPLYPLNSLMLHGLIYARHAHGLDTDPEHDFRYELRTYFGSGTQLQEMYVTPALLSPSDWDDLAEAALWARANADVLADTHWVGGDPAQGEGYGWASWSPRKGILVLRNPSDQPQTLRLDISNAFELPADAPRSYNAHSPWKADAHLAAFPLRAGSPHEFRLKPFEVIVLEATPAGR